MIASLTGTVAKKTPNEAVVDVGGVGYRVLLSLETASRLPQIGSNVSLLVQTIVREDDISLYGFLGEEEKRLFQKLITVNGIGPRMAITILSGIPSGDLLRALQSEDFIRLTAIPGIGRKTAERMIVDLKGRLAEFTPDGALIASSGHKRRFYDDIHSALVNLGYRRPMVEKTLSRMNFPEGASLESLVKEALKRMSGVAG